MEIRIKYQNDNEDLIDSASNIYLTSKEVVLVHDLGTDNFSKEYIDKELIKGIQINLHTK